jgi:hypothetical protein
VEFLENLADRRVGLRGNPGHGLDRLGPTGHRRGRLPAPLVVGVQLDDEVADLPLQLRELGEIPAEAAFQAPELLFDLALRALAPSFERQLAAALPELGGRPTTPAGREAEPAAHCLCDATQCTMHGHARGIEEQLAAHEDQDEPLQ